MFSRNLSLSAFPIYQSLTPEVLATNKARYAKSATIASEATYFRAKLATVKTVDEFLNDYRALKFALTAYSMADQMEYPARIKAILKDDKSDRAALVNRMTSPGYKEINAAFNFFKGGIAKLKDAAFVNTLVQKYSDAQYEQSLGTLNTSISDALYFERKIGAAKSGYDIIGDPILFDVVKTALNISSAGTQTKIERLKAWVERDLDMKRLNEPAYVKKIVNRFLVLKDVEQQRSSSNPLLDMFA